MSDTPAKTPRRRRRKDARPAEIIEAGLAEFAERGFAATRLEDVARRAGIGKATIYLYFESKEALFEAAVRARPIAVLQDIEAAIASFDGPTPDLVERIIRVGYAGFLERDVAPLMRLILTEGRRMPDQIAFYQREAVQKGVLMLRRVVDRGRERGDLRASAVMDEPRVLIAPIVVAMLWRATFDTIDPLPLDAYVEAHVAMVRAGIEPPGAPT